MAYLDPRDRFQVQMRSMEEFVSKDNPVRFIDAFIDHLELAKLGFVVSTVKTEGRPAFNPKVFLKLYFYGYLNGLRSSRKLEKEAIRNVEVHWLLGSLVPNYHSIADFRKQSPNIWFLNLCITPQQIPIPAQRVAPCIHWAHGTKKPENEIVISLRNTVHPIVKPVQYKHFAQQRPMDDGR